MYKYIFLNAYKSFRLKKQYENKRITPHFFIKYFSEEEEEKSSWFSKRETKNVQKLFNYHIIVAKKIFLIEFREK